METKPVGRSRTPSPVRPGDASSPGAVEPLPPSRGRRSAVFGRAARPPASPPLRGRTPSPEPANPSRHEPESKGQGNRPEEHRATPALRFASVASGNPWDEEDFSPNPRLTRTSTLAPAEFNKTDEELAGPSQPEKKSGFAKLFSGKQKTLKLTDAQKAELQVKQELMGIAEGRPLDAPALTRALLGNKMSLAQFIELAGTLTVSARQQILRKLPGLIGDAIGPHQLMLRRIEVAFERSLAAISLALLPSLQRELVEAITKSDPAYYAAAIARATEFYRHIPDPQKLFAKCHETVLIAIAYARADGAITANDVSAFFSNVLLPNELAAIVENVRDAQGMAEHVQTLAIVNQVRTERRQQAAAGYETLVAQLGETMPDERTHRVPDPETYAKSVVQAALHYQSLRSLSGPGPLAARSQEQTALLHRALIHIAFRSNLDDLSETTLKSLEQALRSLDLERPHLEGLLKDVSEALTAKSGQKLADHLASTGRVISKLVHARELDGPTLIDIVHTIRDVRAAHEQSRFGRKEELESELSTIIRGMPEEARLALAQVMRAAPMSQLIDALREVARSAAVTDYDDTLSGDLYRVQSALSAIRTELDPASRPNRIENFSTLRPEVRAALVSCDIHILGDQEIVPALPTGLPLSNSGPASKSLQTTVAGNVRDLAAEPKSGTPLPSRLIDGQMVTNQNLLRAFKTVQEDTVGLSALDNEWAVDSPIRLPDGKRFNPGNVGKYSSAPKHDGKGGLLVRFKSKIETRNGSVVDAAGKKKLVRLTTPMRASLEYEVAISADGAITMGKPVEFWWTGESLPDTAQELFAQANSVLVREFFDYVMDEHSEENIELLSALDRFAEIKDFAQAKQNAASILRTFITQDAPRQVNLPAAVRVNIESALRTATTAKEFAAPFAQARDELEVLLNRDTFARLKSKLGAVRASPPEALAAQDSPAIEQAPVEAVRSDADESRVISGNVGFHLKNLSTVLREPEKVASTLGTLIKTLNEKKVSPSELKKLLTARLDMARGELALSRVDLASLLYNLDNSLTPEERSDATVAMIRSAVVAKLRGTYEGRLTPEGVLLEAAPNEIPVSVVSDWLQRGKVTSEEVVSFLERMPGKRLPNLVLDDTLNPGLAVNATQALNNRERRIEHRAAELKRQLAGFRRELEAARSLTDGFIPRVEVLAAEIMSFDAERTRFNLRADKSLDGAKGEFASDIAASLLESNGRDLSLKSMLALNRLFGAMGFDKKIVEQVIESRKAQNAALLRSHQGNAANQPDNSDELPPPPPDEPSAQ